MPFSIHRADRRHLPDISRLIVETRIGDPLDHLPQNCWFARQDGRIVGFAAGEFADKRTFVGEYLAVEEGCRRQGIGMALFGHMVEDARRRGAKVMGFVTMYYLFNRFKKRGFRVVKRQDLPEALRSHWMFTVKRYMKCAAMIREFR